VALTANQLLQLDYS